MQRHRQRRQAPHCGASMKKAVGFCIALERLCVCAPLNSVLQTLDLLSLKIKDAFIAPTMSQHFYSGGAAATSKLLHTGFCGSSWCAGTVSLHHAVQWLLVLVLSVV